MNRFFEKFKLDADKESLNTVVESIENGVVFRGTNLWVLIFAIFLASLGLNVNSTAVIIGAMLISPLMGPIMGIGLGMGISDIALLRKSIYNYFIATSAALATSTIFFLLSPLNEAHSEILARTSPTIYDVLIAFFGGFAGIIATSSRQKGNVIPGVAIATALMPPLCTAGYGLATFQLGFFMGAFYLYIINTVFIALATLIIVRFLHFPVKHQQNEKATAIAHRIVWVLVILTLLPSLYFGYDMVTQNRFTKKANDFINYEAHFTNDYLLNKKIDAKEKKITLVFGGKEITKLEIANLNNQLKKYGMMETTLEVKQGFAYLAENGNQQDNGDGQVRQLSLALQLKEEENIKLQRLLDSLGNMQKIGRQVYAELKAQYPALQSAIIQPAGELSDSSTNKMMLVLLTINGKLNNRSQATIENWLKIRLQPQKIKLVIQSGR